MPSGVITVSYIAATILFILALGGLSNQETSRRGNLYGIIGMLIALLVTISGLVTANYDLLLGGVIIGGTVGLLLARVGVDRGVSPRRKPNMCEGPLQSGAFPGP